jgi:hypothetical protein
VWSASNTLATVSAAGFVTTLGFATGLDTIRYTVTNACGSVSAEKVVTVYICEGAVGSVGAVQALHIYPNPARGWVNIELPVTQEAMTVIVADMTGRALVTKVYQPGNKKAQIDVHNMPAGNYVIRVSAGDTVFRQMMTIQ